MHREGIAIQMIKSVKASTKITTACGVDDDDDHAVFISMAIM
jgi:hypothetical protein